MLANVTKLSAVGDNISLQGSSNARGRNTVIKEILSETFVRRGREKIRIIEVTLASYQLAKALAWKQLFTDDLAKTGTCII